MRASPAAFASLASALVLAHLCCGVSAADPGPGGNQGVLKPFPERVDGRTSESLAAVGTDGSLGSGVNQVPDGTNTLAFWPAFVNSVGMIIATELGDKTFFIAAIMAMKHDRLVVFAGAMGALLVMTVLSTAIGFALPNLLPRKYTHYASAALFLYFGGRLLWEAYELSKSGESGPSEELQEAEEELGYGKADEEVGAGKLMASQGLSNLKKWKVLSQAFSITFLAEWGDRSQIATIALAAAKDPIGVTVGGLLGHSLCTGLAVVGGRILASRISEKHVALLGGILFLLFGLHALLFEPLA